MKKNREISLENLSAHRFCVTCMNTRMNLESKTMLSSDDFSSIHYSSGVYCTTGVHTASFKPAARDNNSAKPDEVGVVLQSW